MDEQEYPVAVRQLVWGVACLRIPHLYVSERHCWYLRCWYVLIPTKIPTDSPAVTERSLVTLGARCPSGGAERGIFSETWGCWGQGWSPDRIHTSTPEGLSGEIL
ncbi:hypothetical protein BGLA2_1080081 [Burkholderia gladioli]|nr:hypothetical protein BGLA2_1080081 [Burkholderia gladioli]